MISNDKENVNEKVQEEKVDITIDEILAVEDGNLEEMELRQENGGEEVMPKRSEKKSFFGKRLQSIIVDQVLIGVISYILLLASDLFLRFVLGLYIADMMLMFIVLLLIVEILYPLILGGTKGGNTLGRKMAGLSPINK
ncbi:RDD family protein [Clostridium frigidicarnis]|uniref:RDD family protein n=1 Tax=Clostridium frigidicarnis TaxID=84698 RepID=A0A1I0YWP0_9CLOT|nr:RDD family protein [Clostridium frigidicarnis]SFB16810.1 RDD family protein [Clostridium frigidicarnis]